MRHTHTHTRMSVSYFPTVKNDVSWLLPIALLTNFPRKKMEPKFGATARCPWCIMAADAEWTMATATEWNEWRSVPRPTTGHCFRRDEHLVEPAILGFDWLPIRLMKNAFVLFRMTAVCSSFFGKRSSVSFCQERLMNVKIQQTSKVNISGKLLQKLPPPFNFGIRPWRALDWYCKTILWCCLLI